MSNIDIQNMKYGIDRKIFKILGMSSKNYVGTYNFIVRQTINYKKNANGKDSNKFITIISNPEGNYVDYVKGKRADLNNISYGKRCVFIKDNVLITGSGSEPNSVLASLKFKALAKIIVNLVIMGLIIYFSYKFIVNYI